MMLLLTRKQRREHHRSESQKPRSRSKKTQLFTVHQSQFCIVRDFCKTSYWPPSRCNRITGEGLKYLGESLKALTSLHSINLNFSGWVIFWTVILFTCKKMPWIHRSRHERVQRESQNAHFFAIHRSRF